MIMKHICTILLLMLSTRTHAQRQMEYLDRGVVAVPAGNDKIFISWRLLATDDKKTSFNIYRKTQESKLIKLNQEPIEDVTWFIDEGIDTTMSYIYTVAAGIEGEYEREQASYTIPSGGRPYLSIPLHTPAGYTPNDASVADLDGDGAYEIILHQTGRSHNNAHAGFTDPPIIQAYKLDGTFLWQINLGKNIREGAHYTQFMVYDLDGDGRAEIAMKTADGSMDAKGKVIGDSTKNWLNDQGRILAGPEYLSVFDGLTGALINTVNYVPARHPSSLTPTADELKAIWGDGYGQRMDVFLACVAYLDGVHPSLVMCRGYYTRTALTAWDLKNGKLIQRWAFDTDDGWPNYRGQGNHNLSVADVDGDGKDEIVYGAMTIDDNGKGLYSTGLGHGDALHVSDLDPAHPGLEVFDIQERFDDAGANFRDAKTGEVLWKKPSIKAGADGEGPGRGLALDIDPRYPGYECWVAGAGITGLFDCKGNKINSRSPACNMGIFWDGDVLSEILNGTTVTKWGYKDSSINNLFDAKWYNCLANNGTKNNPCLSADIFGDWREELIYRSADNQELRIFTTTLPTNYRFYTFMQDPQYRLSIVWQNVAYNQPPHTGFYMGEGMEQPPKPSISLIKPK
jgi:rhamnogalacturonan endolyase